MPHFPYIRRGASSAGRPEQSRARAVGAFIGDPLRRGRPHTLVGEENGAGVGVGSLGSDNSFRGEPASGDWPRGCARGQALSDNGLMLVMVDLPRYQIAGLMVRPGDILGRTKPGSLIEHRVLLGFNGAIVHSSGPGDVFRPGLLQEVLKDGGVIRVVHRSASVEDTQRRFMNAERLIGVPWWRMNCIQTTDFIVQASRTPWLM